MAVNSRNGRSSECCFSGRWAGLDLGPMLHESMYSVLSRFAQRNALDFKALSAVLGRRRRRACDSRFYLSSADIEKCLNGLTGWNWCSHEVVLEPVASALIHSIWSPVLRYCPVCLEACFHSIWYQAETLSCCPFHGCELVTFCQACGAPTGTYGFSEALFGAPYSCWSCRGPVAGAEFDLSEHLLLRSDLFLIDARLQAVLQWFEAATKRFRCLNPTSSYALPRALPGCDARYLLRHLMCVVQPFSGDPHTRGNITVLTWYVKTDCTSYSDRLTFKRQGWARYGHAQGAYRATLRLLRRAINTEVGGVDSAVSLTVTGRSVSGLFEIHPYVLAYLLLRFVFERRRTWKFDWRSDIAAISDEPIATGQIGEQLGRRCVRAVVLGAYVGILALVKRAQASGELTLDALCVAIDALAYLCIRKCEGADCGFVVFPRVPWLPTGSLRTDRLSVLSSFEKLVAAVSSDITDGDNG